MCWPHCARGDEYIIAGEYHIFQHEAGGTAVLGSVMPFPLPSEDDGGLDPEKVRRAIKADDPHYAITKLVCMENTVSGKVVSLERIRAVEAVAREHGLNTHLDGARMMNAAVALGVSPKELASPFDTVSLCLSKGLGAPVGSVLSGPVDFIARARRMRKMLGGGMRQAGILAAAGLYALDHHIERLADDHANAKRLAESLNAIPGISVDLSRVQSNMVFLEPAAEDAQALYQFLLERGIVLGGAEPPIRVVMHLDVSSGDVDTVIDAVQQFYKN